MGVPITEDDIVAGVENGLHNNVEEEFQPLTFSEALSVFVVYKKFTKICCFNHELNTVFNSEAF